MSPSRKPPECTTLAVLREVAGLSQAELADRTGLRVDTLSKYERSRPAAEEKLRRFAEVMDLRPGLADEVLALVRGARETPEEPGEPLEPSPSLRRRIDEIAAGLARAVVGLVREELLRLFERDRRGAAHREAQELWERLARHPRKVREALVIVSPTFQVWALCLRVCEESEKIAAHSAAQALELAELALLIACRVKGDPRWCARLEAWAEAHLGNALRVHGRLAAAREAFERSRPLWQAGAPLGEALLDEGRLLDLEASLCIEEGEFAAALRQLDRALAAGKPAQTARLLIKRASALELGGDEEGSLATLRRAAPHVDRGREPRLHFALCFNLLTTLCRLGRHAEAEGGLGEVRALAAELGTALDRVRLRWLEATVAVGQGRTAEAIPALETVREAFDARGIPFDFALATLELAALHLTAGQGPKVRELARQAVAVFARHGAHGEALSALRLFAAAAERNRATLALLSRLLTYLRRAQNVPALRFEA